MRSRKNNHSFIFIQILLVFIITILSACSQEPKDSNTDVDSVLHEEESLVTEVASDLVAVNLCDLNPEIVGEGRMMPARQAFGWIEAHMNLFRRNCRT